MEWTSNAGSIRTKTDERRVVVEIYPELVYFGDECIGIDELRTLMPRFQWMLDHPGETPQVEIPETETRWVRLYSVAGDIACGLMTTKDKPSDDNESLPPGFVYLGAFPINIPKRKAD